MVDLKKTLENIAKAVVDEPDAVTVTESVDGNTVTLELSVAPDDMGKVIGKQGRIAKSIRSIMKAAASTTGQKVIVDIR